MKTLSLPSIKRISLLILLCLTCITKVMAQPPATAAAYPFIASLKTFNYLPSGTPVTGIQTDDATVTGLPIGFTFPFCGVNYTTFSVCSNGFLAFGNNASATLTNAATSGQAPAVMPLHDDLHGGIGSAKYLLTGTAPNRVLTMEWRDWQWNYQAGVSVISFQVKLYEGGVIECLYKPEAGAVNTASGGATIGIINTSTDYQTLNNTSSTPLSQPSPATYNTGLIAKPADGQSYMWGILPCSGVPVFNMGGPTIACPGKPFTLNINGTGLYSGLTFQWEYSNNGFTWQPFTGTGAGTNAITDVLTNAPRWFRCIITCTNSSLTYTTPAWKVDVATFRYCYCDNAPTLTTGLDIGNVKVVTIPTGLNKIDTVLNNGTATPPLSNAASNKTYTTFQYSLPPVVMYRDTTYKFLVSQINSAAAFTSGNVAVFIDLNQNGVFDVAEKVMAKTITATSPFPHTEVDTFSIPHSAEIGLTGMRVILSSAATDSCGNFTGSGEVEDYLVDMRYEPCQGKSNAGIAMSTEDKICPDYDYVLTDTSYEKKKSELTRFWEVSPDNIIWYGVAGSTNKDTLQRISTGQPFYYRMRMICQRTDDTSFSTVRSVLPREGYKCYCYSQSKGGFTDTSDIGNITISTFNSGTSGSHLLNGFATHKRTDYTDIQPTELFIDTSYVINITHTMVTPEHGDAKVTVFMDFNNDKEYDIPYERVYTNYTSVGNFTLIENLKIPDQVITDLPTGMRVILNNDLGPNVPSDLACGEYTSGETEDLMVIFRKPIVTSVKGISQVTSFGLTPNPTNGKFRLQFNTGNNIAEAIVTVTNITGQQMLQQTYKNVSGNFTKELDMTGQPAGVYFVELRADGEKLTRKLVLQ